MDFLVIGCGSIGRRHIKNLQKLGYAVYATDLSKESRKLAEESLSIKTYATAEEALKQKPEAVLVCTPPSDHIRLASLALEAGAHVFIEKPVSSTIEGIDELDKKTKTAGKVVQIGYNLRYTPGLSKMKELVDSGKIGKVLSARAILAQYLPYWRPGTDYRKGYTGKQAAGGGIILEASHEIDYMCWLIGKPVAVTCAARKVSSLEVDTEDTADIILDFENGSIATLHLDFVRQDYTRNCELHGEKGTLVWKLEPKSGKNTLELRTPDLNNPGRINSELLVDATWEINDMYLGELKAFVAAIDRKRPPSPTLKEGKLALQVVLKALEASEKKKTLNM
jgi:predicted dehydrogenase